MKNLFKHTSSGWVRYSKYEWKEDKNNKYYITPAPEAMPETELPQEKQGPLLVHRQ